MLGALDGLRDGMVTASVVPSLFHTGYLSLLDLWRIKTGEQPQNPIDPALAKRGHEAEYALIEDLDLKITHNVQNTFYTYNEFLGGTPDGWDDNMVYEFKSTNKWDIPNERIDGWLIQLLTYMLLLKKDTGRLIIGKYDFNNKYQNLHKSLYITLTPENYALQQEIIRRAGQFMQDVNLRNIPLLIDYQPLPSGFFKTVREGI